jgi:hypothetical protein
MGAESSADDRAVVVGTALDYFEGWFDRIEVDVEHLHGTIANATVRSAVYVEYLQLVHTRDGWKIVNALWASATPSQDR